MLVDALRTKRAIAAAGIVGAAISALLLSTWPAHWPVVIALALLAGSAGVLGPVIAALSLLAVDRDHLGLRFGRNARYASLGSGAAAAALGVLGSAVSARAIFLSSAVLSIPALIMLHQLNPVASLKHGATASGEDSPTPVKVLLRDRRLMKLAAVITCFHVANAAMLPIAAGEAVKNAPGAATILIAAGVLISQLVPVVLAPRTGLKAEQFGRRPLLLIAFICLSVRGVLLAFVHSPYLFPFIQIFDGAAAAILGVLLPLLVADLTRTTGRFNLCLALLGMAAGLGASLSTTFAGFITERLDHSAAFMFLALIGLLGTILVWWIIPESRHAAAEPGERNATA